MAEAYDLFLSYSSADERWAVRLARALEAGGVRVYRDKDRNRPGDRFVERLEAAIAGSTTVAFLISAHWANSAWTRNEYEAALQQQKRLIALRLDDTAIPVFLAVRIHVDLRGGQDRFAEGVRQLRWGVTGVLPLEPDAPATGAAPSAAPQSAIAELTSLRAEILRGTAYRAALRLRLAVALAAGLVAGAVVWWAAGAPPGSYTPAFAAGCLIFPPLVTWSVIYPRSRENESNIRRWSKYLSWMEGCSHDPQPPAECDEIRRRFWAEVRQTI